MLAHRERRLFTHAEYFGIEENAECKSEFFRGEIYAMSGGSIEHGQISTNLTLAIGIALRGTSCQLFGADVRLFVAKQDLITYPDLYVVCGPLARMPGRRDTLTDATLIVEILSPKTEIYDRAEKFLFYKSLPSFREYLLVSQAEMEIEHHVRTARGEWRSTLRGPGDQVSLKSIRCNFAVAEVYQGVELFDAQA